MNICLQAQPDVIDLEADDDMTGPTNVGRGPTNVAAKSAGKEEAECVDLSDDENEVSNN